MAEPIIPYAWIAESDGAWRLGYPKPGDRIVVKRPRVYQRFCLRFRHRFTRWDSAGDTLCLTAASHRCRFCGYTEYLEWGDLRTLSPRRWAAAIKRSRRKDRRLERRIERYEKKRGKGSWWNEATA